MPVGGQMHPSHLPPYGPDMKGLITFVAKMVCAIVEGSKTWSGDNPYFLGVPPPSPLSLSPFLNSFSPVN